MNLVREFYANVSAAKENNKVFFRGKLILFAPENIDKVYDLTPIDLEDDE